MAAAIHRAAHPLRSLALSASRSRSLHLLSHGRPLSSSSASYAYHPSSSAAAPNHVHQPQQQWAPHRQPPPQWSPQVHPPPPPPPRNYQQQAPPPPRHGYGPPTPTPPPQHQAPPPPQPVSGPAELIMLSRDGRVKDAVELLTKGARADPPAFFELAAACSNPKLLDELKKIHDFFLRT